MNIIIKLIKVFNREKLIALMCLCLTPALTLADEYSVDYLMQLEKEFNRLQSEINILNEAGSETNGDNNAALYYLKKKSWNKSYNALLTKNTNREHSFYKDILYGISLHGMNKNKEAIKYYKKVHVKSIHYATAQLNLALLYKYDGLNNKAIDIINRTIANSSVFFTRQIKNRIYLILGYLYYVEHKHLESNNAFRKVKFKSIYSSRAIVGLILNARQLHDFKSLEKLSLILMDNKEFDLSSDESYLLKAFSYASLGQHNTAVKAYNEAISHYIKRIKSIDEIINQSHSLVINKVLNKHVFIISNNEIDLLDHYPIGFFNNYAALIKIKKTVSELMGEDNHMHSSVSKLYSKYRQIINKLLIRKLAQRSMFLMDYLNQSRYGLAYSSDLLRSE